MTLHEIIDELHRRHIRIGVQEGNLLVDAPKGVLTEELLQALTARKPELITYFSQSIFREKATSEHSIPTVPNAQHYPLSNAQRRLWILSQMEDGNTAYNMPGSVKLETEDSQLDIQALEQAFVALIRRHESLRTVFLTIDGEPVQKIVDYRLKPVLSGAEGIGDWSTVTYVDLCNEAHPEEEAREFAREDAMKPFDLSTGPLIRVSLLKTDKQTHIMLFNLHHIISDGWSMTILVREFCQLYNYFTSKISKPKPVLSNAEGSKIPYLLSPLRIQYKDYAAWQNRLLADKTIQDHKTYWHEKLSGELPVLELPTDFPRPAVQTFNGDSFNFTIAPATFEQLQAFNRARGLSLFMTLVALVKVLLYRYAGQEDIIVGSPIAGRNHPDLEEQIGVYFNTLALRDQVQGDQSFEEFLQQVKQTATKAYDYQLYPFDRLVEELNVRRDLSRSALFDVLVVLQNIDDMELSLEGLKIRPFEQDTYSSKFDLTFTFAENSDEQSAESILNEAEGLQSEPRRDLQVAIKYNSTLFHKDRIQRMGAHLSTLLNSVLSDPEKPVSRLNILPETERHQLLYEFNDTAAEYSQNTTIVGLFEKQVEKTPENFAVVFENNRLTYRELNDQANQVAHYLQSLGVQPGVTVGICTERSVEMIVGLLGILKAGGAYVPLDPDYPRDRLLFMLDNSQTKILLTQETLASDFSEQIPVVIRLDTDRPRIDRKHRSNPTRTLKPNDLVYIIYTSGSTGQPKGVALEHRSLFNYLSGVRERLSLQSCASFAMVSTIAADLGHTMLYSALLSGACLHILSKERITDSQRIAEYFDNNAIDCLKIVPSHLSALQTAAYPEAGLPRKLLIVGGEAASLPWLKTLQGKVPTIANHYGPTEATIGVLTYQMTGAEKTPLPIGKPLANTQIYILDQHLQLTPIGVPGELHIGGVQLARGYLNRPNLTNERFIPNPFKADPASRLYKTGDLARYLPDGNIEFLGRVDHQVKIRGFRIELGEIETILSKHSAVKDNVVVLKTKEDGERYLVAYVVLKPDVETAGTSEFRDYLKHTLPEYMIPTFFMLLDALPLTPNGKINRKALPEPEHLVSQAVSIPPGDPLELRLSQVWEQVLAVHQIGVTDNFFELGGHSLSAVRLMGLIEQQFGKHLPLATLFQSPTVRDLAIVLRSETELPWSSLVAIQPNGSDPPFFCIPGVGGNVIYLYHLGQSMGADRPFYGLQAVGLDGLTTPHSSIEEMAAHYVEEIQRVQPQGPYFLGGHSFGGKVAFEVAQRLLRQGHTIGRLIILDTTAPPLLRETIEDDTRLVISLSRDISDYSGQPIEVGYEDLCSLSLEEQLRLLSARLEQYRVLEGGFLQLKGTFQIYKANAQTQYRPTDLRPVPISLIKTETSSSHDDDEAPSAMLLTLDWGWREFSDGPVEMVTVPGEHVTMMAEPHVRVLAKSLRACLEQEEKNAAAINAAHLS